MREVWADEKMLDGYEFLTYKEEVDTSGVMLEVETGSTGTMSVPGGARTYLRIKDLRCAGVVHLDGDSNIELKITGNPELMALKETLRFIVQVLEDVTEK